MVWSEPLQSHWSFAQCIQTWTKQVVLLTVATVWGGAFPGSTWWDLTPTPPIIFVMIQNTVSKPALIWLHCLTWLMAVVSKSRNGPVARILILLSFSVKFSTIFWPSTTWQHSIALPLPMFQHSDLTLSFIPFKCVCTGLTASFYLVTHRHNGSAVAAVIEKPCCISLEQVQFHLRLQRSLHFCSCITRLSLLHSLHRWQ